MRIKFNFKKCVWVLASMVAGALAASAVPAHPSPVDVNQSDGTTLTVRLVGDEFYHRTMTTDGYTLLQLSNGDYVYAQESTASRLVPSRVIAHNPQARNAQELRLLSSLPKGLTDKSLITRGQATRQKRDKLMAPRRTDYQNFRGLLILINYNDRTFTYDYDYFNTLMNQQNYSGYYNDYGEFVPCTGSARDYFYQNSMGMFDPVFDVVGPVNVDYSCTTPNGTDDIGGILIDAVNKVDPLVDFSQYDGDGDGEVDMIYFIVAGYTSNFSGNNSGYMWPHQYYLFEFTDELYDGVYLSRYSCSGEIYGWERYGDIDPNGIGTIVHEFTHALGIMDLYDTDYAQNGQANDPGKWDVMSGGSYLNNARTPPGYSIWERYRLGFAEPEVIIEKKAGYSLEPVNTSNTGYMLLTPNDNEVFMVENRQKTGWDEYLPGHGMLVTRVEYDEDQWWYNTINSNADHMYYELLRAGNGTGVHNHDPFPGTNQVTILNNLTTPNLLTWDGQENEMGFNHIAEVNGVIYFDIVNGDGTVPTHGFKVGDLNHDGTVDIDDVATLINLVLGNDSSGCLVCANVDQSEGGTIDIDDVAALIAIILNN